MEMQTRRAVHECLGCGGAAPEAPWLALEGHASNGLDGMPKIQCCSLECLLACARDVRPFAKHMR